MRTIIEYKSGAVETFDDVMPSFVGICRSSGDVSLVNRACTIQGTVPVELVQRVVWEPEEAS